MKSKLMLGVNSESVGERQSDDFYATNPKAIKLFLDKISENGLYLSHKVWEPACGMGHLSKVLIERGYDVRSSDLVDRGYGQGGVDFLSEYKPWDGDVLTNPPFFLAERFIEKGMELLSDGKLLILFLKVQFLEGQKRKKLFEKYPPKYIYCHSSRQHCSKDGDFEKYQATTMFFCWFVWQKGFSGEPIVRWI